MGKLFLIMLFLLDRIEFLLSEALIALRRNAWMTFSAVTTVTVALYLLGGLAFTYYRVHHYVSDLPNQFQIRVFLKSDVSEPQILETQAAMKRVDGVKNVEWISKEVAWQQQQKEMPEVTAGLENPLPDAFRVTLSDLHKAKDVVAQIQTLPIVESDGVNYYDEERQMLTEVLDLVQKLGGVLGTLMLLTSGVLIYNTIRLTIFSRRREIRIMQLIGVTGFTIVVPLLLEGVFQGAVGGVFAAWLLNFSHMSLQHLFESFMAARKLSSFPIYEASIILGVLGAVYGFLCSSIAVFESRKKI